MTTRNLTFCVALLAALLVRMGGAACAADYDAKEADLIAVLKSGAPAEKAIACKQLAIKGTAKAVPDLAPLLTDEQLASWARIALEAIPGEEADKALRDAAGTLKGRLLIGTINSIGVRKDAVAVEPLSGYLKDEDVDVASAAALALGRIGDAAATKALRATLAADSKAVRSAAAEGCILCAERLDASGKSSEAVALFDEVRKADVAKPRILEATRGAILARKTEGIPLLTEQLYANDKAVVNLGLTVARELEGEEVNQALADLLVKVAPERAALILYALADRKITTLPPAVLTAAKSGEKPVRIAAIGFMGRSGDPSALDTLLAIAAAADKELSDAAKTALAEMPGKKVDTEISARLSKADNKTLPVLIQLVGQRRIEATDFLKKALDNSQVSIRNAALSALGETIAQKDLPVLIAQFVATKNADSAQAAEQALKAACVRMPDREACAAELTAAMSKAPVTTQSKLLEILAAVGGKKSLETIASALTGNNAELQDTGSRVLGDWMSVDAAPVLLDAAKDPKNKFQVRALRGYIRLARQFQVPDKERAEMCQKALDAATRLDEQKLVMVVLERYPSGDTLRVAVKATEISALKAEAQRVALAIAQKLGGSSADAKELLAKIGLEAVKLEIVKAVYGAGAQQKDVTEIVQKGAGTSALIVLPKPMYNDSFGGDPAPSVPKKLHIQYKLNGKAGEATFDENALIILPAPK